MARIDYWQYFVDRQGRPLEDTEVRVYLSGTLTEANIFLHPKFASFTQSSAEDLKTSKFGFIQFWIGDQWEVEGGYDEDQTFKIVWQNTVDGIEEEIDDLHVFAPVSPIVLEKTDKNLNKVISNKQGNKWDTHVDSIVPSASPHDLEPVEFFDLDIIPNRVISNKVGYQMYQLSSTALATPIDVSAARFYSEQVSSWTTSGGMYYKEIRHNFNNYYPIVRVHRVDNDYQITPKRVESVSPDWTRVWIEDNITVRVSIYG